MGTHNTRCQDQNWNGCGLHPYTQSGDNVCCSACGGLICDRFNRCCTCASIMFCYHADTKSCSQTDNGGPENTHAGKCDTPLDKFIRQKCLNQKINGRNHNGSAAKLPTVQCFLRIAPFFHRYHKRSHNRNKNPCRCN